MYIIRNDLNPRYPTPRPLVLFEQWAAVVSRVETVAMALEEPRYLSRLYACCQRTYTYLNELVHDGAYPAPEALPAFETLLPAAMKLEREQQSEGKERVEAGQGVCLFCGKVHSEESLIEHRLVPSYEKSSFVKACPECHAIFAKTSIDPMLRCSHLHFVPSIPLMREYLRLLYCYGYENNLLDRLYQLDLFQPRYNHPFDLAGLDIHFAHLAVFFRTKGKSPVIPGVVK